MLAAFYVLLQRYSGAGEVIVGSGLANRRLRELDAMLGMFINTVALRVDLSDDPSPAELLGRVRAAVLEAQENQDVPFPRVVEAIAPAASSHTPLYQTLFDRDAPLPDLMRRLRSCPTRAWGTARRRPRSTSGGNHDGREVPTEPTIIWEYNSDLFPAATPSAWWGTTARCWSRSSPSPPAAPPRSGSWTMSAAAAGRAERHRGRLPRDFDSSPASARLPPGDPDATR